MVPISVGSGAGPVAYGAGSVWVANTLDGTLSRIDPARNAVVGTVAGLDGPTGIAITSAGVWVSTEFNGSVALVDTRTDAIVRRIRIGARPRAIATDAGRVWVGMAEAGIATAAEL